MPNMSGRYNTLCGSIPRLPLVLVCVMIGELWWQVMLLLQWNTCFQVNATLASAADDMPSTQPSFMSYECQGKSGVRRDAPP
jgi:hypothetical protein